MEIREIEAFLALAEELHFGHTAERLGISSGRVSQLIQALERRVGGHLVLRTSRHVQLIPLGERFRQDAQAGYLGLEQAITAAQATAARDNGDLSVGASRITSIPVVTEICEAFERRYPQWRVHRVTTNSHRMWEPLHQGDADLLFARMPCPPELVPDQPGILLGPVAAREARVILAAEDHPLADRQNVHVEELGNYAVVRWSDMLPAWFINAWAPATTPCSRAIPRGDEIAVESEEFYDQIVRRGLLHIAPAGALEIIPWPRVVAVPLIGLPPFHVVLARLAGQDGVAVKAMLKMVADNEAAGPA